MSKGGGKKNNIVKIPVNGEKFKDKKSGLMNLIKPGKELNFGRWFLGTILIIIGIVYLLEKLGFFPFVLGVSIWQLWPLVIVYVGLIFLGGKNKIFAVLVFGIVLLVTIYVAFIMFSPMFEKLPTNAFPISVDVETNTKVVNYSFEANQADIAIRGGSENLLTGTATSSMNVVVDSYAKFDIQEVFVKALTDRKVFWGSTEENNFDLIMNSDMPALLHFDVSSLDLNLDMSALRIDYLDIDTGASNLNIKLGSLLDKSLCDLNVGAGVIDITVPKDVSVRLVMDSGFSKKELNGFFKVSERVYESYNYGKTDKTVEMNLNLGVAHLQIGWVK